MNNKARKGTLFHFIGFLKNPHISIPYKRISFSAISHWTNFLLFTSNLNQIKKETGSHTDTS